MSAFIELRELSRSYELGRNTVNALQGVTLTIQRGEFVAIMGPSGSGKSTLMNLLGCLDSPSEGRYWLDGVDVASLGRENLAAVRNRMVGFVFQNFNLLPRLTAVENIELPLLYSRMWASERRRRAHARLADMGLANWAQHTPSELSGGQQQRVAIARALSNDPSLLLADEPTGALDSRTGKGILTLLRNLNREQGVTIVLVTHDLEVAAYADRVVGFRDGRIVSDLPVTLIERRSA
jgi:putative ABC transport system ATP-binding protein